MRKLLIAAAAVLALTIGAAPAQAEFGQTNAEKGCAILTINTSTRIEDMPWMNPTGCAKLKADTAAATKEEKDGWFTCTVGMIMARNRARGVPDFDKPSLEIRRNITKGCLMLMKDLDETRADYLVTKNVN
jgi:hypothetical protein